MAVFASVVREGSFRGAGRQLGLSASVVSHHVAQLEKRLGHALLYRSTRKLALTAEGEGFFESCARAVDAAQEGLNRLQANQKALVGRLRVAAPALLAYGPFLQDVWSFAQVHPGVRLELQFTDEPAHPIQAAIDVSIRIGGLEDSSMRARKLFEVDQVICATPSLLSAHPPVKRPTDLTRLPWIGSTTLPGFLDLKTDGPSPHQRIGLSSHILVDNGAAARSLALAGAGALLTLDFFVAQALANGTLMRLLPSWQLPRTGFYAVWPNNVTRGALASRFVEFLYQKVGQNTLGAQTDSHRIV